MQTTSNDQHTFTVATFKVEEISNRKELLFQRIILFALGDTPKLLLHSVIIALGDYCTSDTPKVLYTDKLSENSEIF